VPAVRFIGKLIRFALLLGLLVGLMLHLQVATYPYLSSALVGSVIIQLWSRPRTGWLPATLLFGAGFAVVYEGVLGGPFWGTALACLGLGSLASLACAALWGQKERRQASLETCFAASLFPLFLVIAGFSLALTNIAYPKTYDAYLYAFDEQIGVQVSFVIGRLLTRWSGLRQVCWLGYEGLPMAMALAFAMERNRTGRRTSSIMTAFVVAAAGGFVLYNLYPATGPRHVFGPQFPYAHPVAQLPPLRLVSAGAAPRNAMPSIHISMALLIAWNSRAGPRLWRWMAGALFVVTVLATLGFGEHYLVDLFVAVPFALLAQAVGTSGVAWRNPARLAAAGTGAALVQLWIAYLRSPSPPFYGHGAVAWSLLTGTAIAALWMECSLASAARAVNQRQQVGSAAVHRIMEACRM
jgi:hypothetical protein